VRLGQWSDSGGASTGLHSSVLARSRLPPSTYTVAFTPTATSRTSGPPKRGGPGGPPTLTLAARQVPEEWPIPRRPPLQPAGHPAPSSSDVASPPLVLVAVFFEARFHLLDFCFFLPRVLAHHAPTLRPQPPTRRPARPARPGPVPPLSGRSPWFPDPVKIRQEPGPRRPTTGCASVCQRSIRFSGTWSLFVAHRRGPTAPSRTSGSGSSRS